jgi:hypothetical protein
MRAEAETETRPLCACVRRNEVWAQNLCMTLFLRHTGHDLSHRAPELRIENVVIETIISTVYFRSDGQDSSKDVVLEQS